MDDSIRKDILSNSASVIRRHEIDLKPRARKYLLKTVPIFLLNAWAQFRKGETDDGSLGDFHCDIEDPDVRRTAWVGLQSLFTLHAIADEACIGMGVWQSDDDFEKNERRPDQACVRAIVQELMFQSERVKKNGATLSTVDTSLRVLPKRHNPEIGMTLRSMSSYVGHHRSSVKVTWDRAQSHAMASQIDKHDRLSVLLLPWPLSIQATDFHPVDEKPIDMADRYGLFTFGPVHDPAVGQDFKAHLKHAIDEAKSELGALDLVVLPELGINDAERVELENLLEEKKVSAYIAGVRQGVDAAGFGSNTVYCKQLQSDCMLFPGKTEAEQAAWRRSKHHRWKLTHSQLVQYSLAYRLQTSRAWWESIRIGRREVRFINISRRLTICPLICEDLARQDPIADLIRTVGPSLVVTILMDGPQIVERWSARYASVLADDPGSSVLTLTSAGMVDRYGPSPADRSKLGPHRSRAIALWRDPDGSKEISLSEDCIGVALSLNINARDEAVADGRRERVATAAVVFGGEHQIRAP